MDRAREPLSYEDFQMFSPLASDLTYQEYLENWMMFIDDSDENMAG